ncbi:MAG: RNA 2',3'-cyclic phosphodiesterase [Acholeplasmatales bacterium]|nr:MAG: RNA 2',3'-cyclic phosphodiesterase [Acholeplasmatales bacterium]
MRVFIGVDFNVDVKHYLQTVQTYIKSTAIGGNFTKFDNFHMTLRYVGHVELAAIDILSDMLDDVTTQQKAFSITIGDLGAFGKGEKKLIYVPVKTGKEPLLKIDADLRRSLDALGFEYDSKKLLPHVTVAREVRFNNQINPSMPMPLYTEKILVSAITLFASVRREGLLQYEPLHQARLEP